jgi:rhodanese-related sulfurtransferase
MPQPIGFEELGPLLADAAQLVEVLPEEDYVELHLPGAINIPLKELDADTTAQLSRTDPVVVYCWDAL